MGFIFHFENIRFKGGHQGQTWVWQKVFNYAESFGGFQLSVKILVKTNDNIGQKIWCNFLPEKFTSLVFLIFLKNRNYFKWIWARDSHVSQKLFDCPPASKDAVSPSINILYCTVLWGGGGGIQVLPAGNLTGNHKENLKGNPYLDPAGSMSVHPF